MEMYKIQISERNKIDMDHKKRSQIEIDRLTQYMREGYNTMMGNILFTF